ncbi:hypothetical protein INT45_012959 [Circinella minor]|uniref:Uncharacterized protein n=1 Tax=Circinella minor TaxID=1195481 RepID=A0A8H7R8I2_9FUNG|nr:hypothetical protein INT45_012959 [Circinella minor]
MAVRGDTVVPKNEPPKADIKTANTSKVVPSNVNLVETAETDSKKNGGINKVTSFEPTGSTIVVETKQGAKEATTAAETSN